MTNRDEAYIKALEKQCAEWEEMYKKVAAERDQWKERCLESETAKAQVQRQLRHI